MPYDLTPLQHNAQRTLGKSNTLMADKPQLSPEEIETLTEIADDVQLALDMVRIVIKNNQ